MTAPSGRYAAMKTQCSCCRPRAPPLPHSTYVAWRTYGARLGRRRRSWRPMSLMQTSNPVDNTGKGGVGIDDDVGDIVGRLSRYR